MDLDELLEELDNTKNMISPTKTDGRRKLEILQYNHKTDRVSDNHSKNMSNWENQPQYHKHTSIIAGANKSSH